MSDPESFVSFADYLGLNSGAGQQMLDRTMEGGNKLRDEAEAASQAHYGAARAAGNGEAGGEAAYARTGEQARKGLASYGEFMKGLKDPEARQVLMEKVYGKGAVSRWDAALMGGEGSGRIAQGQKDYQGMQTRFEGRDIDADARKGRYAAQTAAQNAEQVRSDQQRAAERKRLGDISAVNREREEWKKINDHEDTFRQGGKTTPNPYEGTWRTDPATGKRMTAAAYKKSTPQYGWGGTGDLKSASGGSL